MKTPAVDQVNALTTIEYFSYLAQLMKTNPPLPQDAPMLPKMSSVGLQPARDFDSSKFDTFDKAAVSAIPKLALQKIFARFKNQAAVNGWLYFGPAVGNWGTDYFLRALCNMLGPGWNVPADAVYPASETQADGQPYDGNKKYVIHFRERPTATGQRLLVANDVRSRPLPHSLIR